MKNNEFELGVKKVEMPEIVSGIFWEWADILGDKEVSSAYERIHVTIYLLYAHGFFNKANAILKPRVMDELEFNKDIEYKYVEACHVYYGINKGRSDNYFHMPKESELILDKVFVTENTLKFAENEKRDKVRSLIKILNDIPQKHWGIIVMNIFYGGRNIAYKVYPQLEKWVMDL